MMHQKIPMALCLIKRTYCHKVYSWAYRCLALPAKDLFAMKLLHGHRCLEGR